MPVTHPQTQPVIHPAGSFKQSDIVAALRTGNVALGERHGAIEARFDLFEIVGKQQATDPVLRQIFLETGADTVAVHDPANPTGESRDDQLNTIAATLLGANLLVGSGQSKAFEAARDVAARIIDLDIAVFAFDKVMQRRGAPGEAATFRHDGFDLEKTPVDGMSGSLQAGRVSIGAMEVRNRNMALIFAALAGQSGALTLNGIAHLRIDPAGSDQISDPSLLLQNLTGIGEVFHYV